MSIHKDGFIPYQTEGFSFGFEIEGIFHERLKKLVERGGDWKADGSVSIRQREVPLGIEDWLKYSQYSYATEYASPILESVDKLIEQLRLFSPEHNKGNYYSNSSCGVHIHIGYKQANVLANKFRSQAILEQLQNQFMPLVCKCVKERVNKNQWANLHTLFRNGRAIESSKYRAVNFHKQGTIELRLFAPCKHLIGNIQKVLTEFFRVGYRDYSHETEPITCIFTEGEKIDITEVLTPEKKVFNYGFNERSIYPISPMAQIADFTELSTWQNAITGQHQALLNNYDIFRYRQDAQIGEMPEF